jgi:hypothetical protein
MRSRWATSRWKRARTAAAAIKERPKQFESLFMRELIKSMREATMKSGMLDNPGSDLGTDLLDQQFAVQMSGQPGGLADFKAGANWTGKVAEVTTTEYVNGAPQKCVQKFRAYDSYADAFKDYARMISESPRYAKVKEQANSAHSFATGLQKAGYATDPDYAAKLSRAINTTLAIRRAQA